MTQNVKVEPKSWVTIKSSIQPFTNQWTHIIKRCCNLARLALLILTSNWKDPSFRWTLRMSTDSSTWITFRSQSQRKSTCHSGILESRSPEKNSKRSRWVSLASVTTRLTKLERRLKAFSTLVAQQSAGLLNRECLSALMACSHQRPKYTHQCLNSEGRCQEYQTLRSCLKKSPRMKSGRWKSCRATCITSTIGCLAATRLRELCASQSSSMLTSWSQSLKLPWRRRSARIQMVHLHPHLTHRSHQRKRWHFRSFLSSLATSLQTRRRKVERDLGTSHLSIQMASLAVVMKTIWVLDSRALCSPAEKVILTSSTIEIQTFRFTLTNSSSSKSTSWGFGVLGS